MDEAVSCLPYYTVWAKVLMQISVSCFCFFSFYKRKKTSSIDNKSDAHISLTVHQEFSDSTLLVIAHRLRTIINFDYVLVLDQGRVVEYGQCMATINIGCGCLRDS